MASEADIKYPYYDTEPLMIVKRTNCRLHNHVFTWTGVGGREEVPLLLRCDCEKWSWRELSKVVDDAK